MGVMLDDVVWRPTLQTEGDDSSVVVLLPFEQHVMYIIIGAQKKTKRSTNQK